MAKPSNMLLDGNCGYGQISFWIENVSTQDTLKHIFVNTKSFPYVCCEVKSYQLRDLTLPCVSFFHAPCNIESSFHYHRTGACTLSPTAHTFPSSLEWQLLLFCACSVDQPGATGCHHGFQHTTPLLGTLRLVYHLKRSAESYILKKPLAVSQWSLRFPCRELLYNLQMLSRQTGREAD